MTAMVTLHVLGRTQVLGIFSLLDCQLFCSVMTSYCMFGARVNPSFSTRFITFNQCARCHVLSHATEECKRPATLTRCHICGIAKHTAKEHAHHCPNKKKHSSGLYCDCSLKCFNCIYAGKSEEGHLAINNNCPLKKNMQHFKTLPLNDNNTTPQITNPTNAPARVDNN